jgi:hypothetical protein
MEMDVFMSVRVGVMSTGVRKIGPFLGIFSFLHCDPQCCGVL